jgi:hypothetical protein
MPSDTLRRYGLFPVENKKADRSPRDGESVMTGWGLFWTNEA